MKHGAGLLPVVVPHGLPLQRGASTSLRGASSGPVDRPGSVYSARTARDSWKISREKNRTGDASVVHTGEEPERLRGFVQALRGSPGLTEHYGDARRREHRYFDRCSPENVTYHVARTSAANKGRETGAWPPFPAAETD